MHDIDLNLLYTLHTFVDRGSLAETARALSRSEPAISARLHRLEEELGIAIFERVGRRLMLTPAGRELHREASLIIDRIRSVVDVAQAVGDEPRGRLRVGTLGTVGMYMLGGPVAEFVVRYPHASVDMIQGLSTDLASQLLAGELDLVASIGELPLDERVHVEVVREIRPVVVTRRSDIARRTKFDAKRLSKHPLLEWGLAADVFFGRVSRYLAEHGLDDNVRVRVPHIATLKVLIRNGAGIAILPDYTVVDDDLIAHPIKDIDVMQPLWLAYRHATAQHATFAAFRDLLDLG